MNRLIPVVVCALSLCSAETRAFDPFSRELDSVEAGNQLYTEQHYDQALERYESAEREVVQEPRVHFNRGAALFKLGRSKEAREAFLRASGTDDPQVKKQNYYNIGNTFLSEGAFRDAMSYYRRALEIDPGFDDARFNLELALRALQQQQQEQQQQDGQSGQPQDQQEDQEKQDQQEDREQEGSKDKGEPDEKEKDDQQEGDQQEQQQEQQQQEQEGQEDQKDQPGEQEKQQQEGQQDQSEEQKEQRAAEEQEERERRGQPDAQRKKIPAQLSQAEFEDLLDSMRDSEKPFQMHRFVMPEYRQKQVEKDW